MSGIRWGVACWGWAWGGWGAILIHHHTTADVGVPLPTNILYFVCQFYILFVSSLSVDDRVRKVRNEATRRGCVGKLGRFSTTNQPPPALCMLVWVLHTLIEALYGKEAAATSVVAARPRGTISRDRMISTGWAGRLRPLTISAYRYDIGYRTI